MEQEYDIIYASGLLQYIPENQRKNVIENIKSYTAQNGINVFNVFVKKPFIEDAPDWESKEYYWKSGELFSFYHDWKIDRMEEIIFDCNSSWISHQHCMDVMIARKVREKVHSG